jgi:HEAT repeat protein
LRAVNALRAIADADVAPALAEALKDADPDVRDAAAITLKWIGPSAEVVPALAEVLNDKGYFRRERQRAAYALGRFGPAAADAVPALAQALKDKSSDISIAAANALEAIGPAAAPALAEALKDADSDVRLAAAYAFGAIGPAAADAAPALAEALKDADPNVRDAAAYALESISPKILIFCTCRLPSNLNRFR